MQRGKLGDLGGLACARVHGHKPVRGKLDAKKHGRVLHICHLKEGGKEEGMGV